MELNMKKRGKYVNKKQSTNQTMGFVRYESESKRERETSK